MDIPINAEVSCLDGPCGRTTNLILNPTTEEITHVSGLGLFLSRNRIPSFYRSYRRQHF